MTGRMNFIHELQELNDNVKEMGLKVEYAYESLFKAIANEDQITIEEIKKNDRYVNDMERQIESKCLALITKQQPVAKDLRMVSAALKVVTDIERVGDNVADIAELIMRLENKKLSDYSKHLEPMILATKQLLHEGVDAFVMKDIEKAKKVILGDDVIDDYFNLVKEDIVAHIKGERNSVDECIDILMLNKYLEKIGDHAVNIAEWEIFQETGSINNIRLL